MSGWIGLKKVDTHKCTMPFDDPKFDYNKHDPNLIWQCSDCGKKYVQRFKTSRAWDVYEDEVKPFPPLDPGGTNMSTSAT